MISVRFIRGGVARRLAKCFLLTALLALPEPALWGAPNQRKDIQNLSPEELARYKAAFRKLKETGELKKLADLHNRFVGDSGCYHKQRLFMPWHRAHLLLFEQALQRVDPGVVLPYWNWSQLPHDGGKTYPVPFEDTGSVLFEPRRNKTPGAGCPDFGSPPKWPAFPWPELQGEIDTNPTWAAFGGRESSPGAIEVPYHDTMHGLCLGRPMSSVTTAAEDPIFWSFHTFIDLVWDRWQKRYPGSPVDCPDCELRGLKKPDGTRFRVGDVLKVEDLGYAYQFSPPALHFAPQPLQAVAATAALTAALEATEEQETVFVYDVEIPESPDFRSARLELSNVDIGSSFVQGGAYLHPASEEARPGDPEFRRKYLADRLALWPTSHHNGEDHGQIDVSLDLTTELKYLSQSRPGEAWRITLVIVPAPPEAPAGEEAVHGHGAAATFRFENATLILDGDKGE